MTYRKLWMAAAAAAITVSVSAPPALAASSHAQPATPSVIRLAKVLIPQKHLIAGSHKTDAASTTASGPTTSKTDSGLANGTPTKE